VPRAHDITVCLLGSEQHKARPDLSDDSGFWLCVKAHDASPIISKRLLLYAPAVTSQTDVKPRAD
jgi:hypothetical protein